jgi:L-2-hydroxyglutarate oxidase LhgO
MTAERVDCIVIGAGAVGLAVAAELARAGRDVLVLERNGVVGAETSSRNSEVVHAGLYYAPNSLKAKLCVTGRRKLYAFCAEHGVECTAIGKLIVAVDELEVPGLHALRQTALANGVDDVVMLSRAEALRLEPALNCVAALWSPSTGIVDSHAFMMACRGLAESDGALLSLLTEADGGAVQASGLAVHVAGNDPIRLIARTVINCAGLGASTVARWYLGATSELIPATRYCKGNYFSIGSRVPFSRLIYPAPNRAGLGIHLTFDHGSRARFGPDVEWVDKIDYRIDGSRSTLFETAIRRYWPDLPADSLRPDYAGIRPKIVGPDQPAADFIIQGASQHGIPGLINLFGIESPGLTAALAIAEYVGRLASQIDG